MPKTTAEEGENPAGLPDERAAIEDLLIAWKTQVVDTGRREGEMEPLRNIGEGRETPSGLAQEN